MGLGGWQPERAGCPGQLPPLQVSCPVGVAATPRQALTLCRPFPRNEKQRRLHSYWLWGLGFTPSDLVQPLREPVSQMWSREEFCSFSGDPAPSGPRNEPTQEATGASSESGPRHKGGGGG